MIRRRLLALLIAVATAVPLLATPAAAATPTVVWTAPGQTSGFFSDDGTLAVTSANTSAGGRLEIRQAGTGSVVRVLTSPLKFNAVALSADKQLVAVTVNDTSSGLTVRAIRVYRVSTGALVRAIATTAARDQSSLHFAPDGRTVAAADARSYERGGEVHVHRVSDGARVRILTVPATTAAVRFSPDGRFLAANDRLVVDGRFVPGVRVFRTDTWASVLSLADGNLLIRWTPDSTAIWTRRILPGVPTGLRLVSVPSGAVLRSLDLALYESVSDVTDDGAYALTHPVVAPRRSMTFTSTLTGADVATFEFGQDVFPGDISRDGTLFSYGRSTGPSAFDVHVARSPSL